MPALSYSISPFQPNTRILSADVNSNFDAIKTLLNTTGLDDSNIQNAGITRATKLKTGTAGAVLVNAATTGVMSELIVSAGSLILGAGSAVPTVLAGATAGRFLMDSGSAWAAYVADESTYLANFGLSASVAASALTIALKDKSGSDASSTSPARIGFRNATSATGTYLQRTVTAALSTVISSGSTAGFTSALKGVIYVYAIDNAGTVELAWSGSHMGDEGTVVTTTAEGGAGAADSRTTMYSTTARSNVPFRLLGRITSTQTTAGTWASAPSEISLVPFLRPAPQNEVWLIAGNGYGSSSTKIPKFSTIQRNIGTAISYNSGTIATLGTEFTINEDGVYHISFSQEPNSATDFNPGISINSAELTTNVTTIVATSRLAFSRNNNSTVTSRECTAVSVYCYIGDVIRPHTNGETNDGTGTTVHIIKG